MRRLVLPIAVPTALVTAALLLLLTSSQRANAGGPDLEVDTTADDAAKTACTAAANDCSLRGAIINANTNTDHNTILLNGNVSYEITLNTPNDNINAGGDLDIETSLTIEGDGTGVDGNDIDRVFDIDAGPSDTVTFNDLSIVDGNESFFEGGGGVYVSGGNLVLNAATFASNTTTQSGGGLLFSSTGDLTVTGTTFAGNHADFDGGGLNQFDSNTSTVLVADSTFAGNTAGEGGGIGLGISESTLIDETDVIGNTATQTCTDCVGGGGGIYSGAGNINITGGSITGNVSMSSSGGAYIPFLVMSGTSVTGNTAANEGGGVYTFGGSISGVDFTGNAAAVGGGLHVAESHVSFTSFVGNTATEDGGGIFLHSNAALDHIDVYGNTATDAGGGVAVGHGTTSIANASIFANEAARGGGIARGTDATGRIGTAPQGDGPPPPAILNLTFVTIASNSAPSAANVFNGNDTGGVNIGSSIIAYSEGGGSDCNLALTSTDYNVEEGTSCALNAAHDIDGVDPDLADAGDNGGTTLTLALGEDSPAVDHVSAGCPPPGDDQREPGFPRAKGNACDAGAFESDHSAATPTPSPSPSVTPTTKVWGDHDCDDDVDDQDGLALISHVAGTPTAPAACEPALADTVTADGNERTWGNINCSAELDVIDALLIFKDAAGLGSSAPGSCPNLHDEVPVSG